MQWTLEWDPSARRELKKLGPQARRRILDFFNNRLLALENPRHLGEPLTGSALGDYWKYRIGDYRVIANLEDRILRIMVVRVGHRREVYKPR